jgi:uncharacterized membrane protein YkoI
MKRRNSIVLAAAAAVVAIGAATVIAQPTQQQPAGPGAQAAQTSLASAIQLAEQQTGGRARKAELERDRGIDAYEIKTVARDKSAKVMVELASGKVLRVEGPGFLENIANALDNDDQREDQAALARLEASPMTLAAAIGTAERETGGRAVKAALKSEHGTTFFEVRVVKDLVPQKILVDPASGKVVPVATREKKKDDDD